MRRFRFRLQRILDLMLKQEEVLKERLFEATVALLAAQRAVMDLDEEMERRCERERLERAASRWDDEDVFASYCTLLEGRIEEALALQGEREIERERALSQLAEVSAFRRAVEKLREKALEEHRVAEEREEQKVSDEHTSVKFARERLQAVGE